MHIVYNNWDCSTKEKLFVSSHCWISWKSSCERKEAQSWRTKSPEFRQRDIAQFCEKMRDWIINRRLTLRVFLTTIATSCTWISTQGAVWIFKCFPRSFPDSHNRIELGISQMTFGIIRNSKITTSPSKFTMYTVSINNRSQIERFA